MAFSDPEDLRKLLKLETIDEEEAGFILGLAEDAVLAEVRQDIAASKDQEVTLDGTGTPVLLLPQVPVSDVSSVVEHDQELTEGRDYVWSSSGVLTRLRRAWSALPRSVVVVYSHGHEKVPGVVRSATVQAAARVWPNRQQLSQESIGDYSRSFATSSAPPGRIQLTEYERELLGQYRAKPRAAGG